MNASKCGFTVTGTRTRYECFLRKLKSSGLIIYNILIQLFPHDANVDLRKTIKNGISKDSTYDRFKYELHQKFPNMDETIKLTLRPYMELMGLKVISCELDFDPTRSLWLFMTRTIYEKPSLLMPDNLNGDNVMFIQESFKQFISEQVCVQVHE